MKTIYIIIKIKYFGGAMIGFEGLSPSKPPPPPELRLWASEQSKQLFSILYVLIQSQ